MRCSSEGRPKDRGSVLALVAVWLAAGCSGPELQVLERRSPRFLERDGDELFLDGRPFRFLSFNAFTLTGCGSDDEVPDDEELEAFFAALRPRSVVRTYALEPLGLTAVERVIGAARTHDHLLTLVLTDDASSCGEGEVKKTEDWYANGFREAYLPWVRSVVARFSAEPAVAFWEPVKGVVEVDPSTLRTFYDVVGGEIRQLDDHHLIESGTHGPWAYGGESGYELVSASAGIDVASFHDYDNVADAPPTLEASMVVAERLDKPLVLSETGMFASRDGDVSQELGPMTCISWNARRDAYERQLTAAFASRLSGVQIWNWVPNPAPGCAIRVSPEDPLVDLVRHFPIAGQ